MRKVTILILSILVPGCFLKANPPEQEVSINLEEVDKLRDQLVFGFTKIFKKIRDIEENTHKGLIFIHAKDSTPSSVKFIQLTQEKCKEMVEQAEKQCEEFQEEVCRYFSEHALASLEREAFFRSISLIEEKVFQAAKNNSSLSADELKEVMADFCSPLFFFGEGAKEKLERLIDKWITARGNILEMQAILEKAW